MDKPKPEPVPVTKLEVSFGEGDLYTLMIWPDDELHVRDNGSIEVITRTVGNLRVLIPAAHIRWYSIEPLWLPLPRKPDLKALGYPVPEETPA